MASCSGSAGFAADPELLRWGVPKGEGLLTPSLRSLCEQVDAEPVAERSRHDEGVPHLVVAERRRPRIRSLHREHDRTDRVEQTAGAQETDLDPAHCTEKGRRPRSPT